MEQKKYEKQNIKTLSIMLSLNILKWVLLSLIMGIVIGIVVGFFNIILKVANDYRREHNYLVYFLPIAGIVIAYVYVKTGRNAYSGENLLKSEVQRAAKNIPAYMMFVVFMGSLLTTFFGGSAGKEGSGVAMGGTFGDFLARKLKLKDKEQRTLVISGVGSAFGVLYNVPFAGAILGMELVLKGSFNYESLIPAFLTSVTANEVAQKIGSKSIKYVALDLGGLDFILILKLIVFGMLCGIIGMLFNFMLDNSSKVYSYFIKNPLIKGFVGGILTIALFLILGENYNGLGQSFINASFEKPVPMLSFFWKILFTAVALGSVFQGGRGNPVFFTGATFGSSIAGLFNISVGNAAALGMIGLFCSAQALPITSIAIAIEYFGSKEVMAIIIVVVVSYSISGFYDIFTERKLTKGKSTIFMDINDYESKK